MLKIQMILNMEFLSEWKAMQKKNPKVIVVHLRLCLWVSGLSKIELWGDVQGILVTVII